MKKATFEKLNQIEAGLSVLIQEKKINIDNKGKDKLHYAVSKLATQVQKHKTDFNTFVEEINIEHAAVDINGAIVYETMQKGEDIVTTTTPKFSKQGLKEKRDAFEKLIKREVEIEPYFYKNKEVIDTFHPYIKKHLNGFLFEIDEQEVDPLTDADLVDFELEKIN